MLYQSPFTLAPHGPEAHANRLAFLYAGLVSHWKFNESSGNPADSYGSNTLTNRNNTTFDTGLLGNQAILDEASDQGFALSGNSGINAQPFTFSGWFTIENTGANQSIACRTTTIWLLQALSTRVLRFYLSSGSHFVHTTTAAFTYGTPFHLAATYDGSGSTNTDKAKIYVDGVLRSNASSGTVPATLNYGATSMMFGIGPNDLTTQTLNGAIDDCAMWSRVLSAAEIAQLYNGGTPLHF